MFTLNSRSHIILLRIFYIGHGKIQGLLSVETDKTGMETRETGTKPQEVNTGTARNNKKERK